MDERVCDYNITNGPNRSPEAVLVSLGQVWHQLVLYKTELIVNKMGLSSAKLSTNFGKYCLKN